MNELYAQYQNGRAANIRPRSQIRFPNSSNRIDLLTDAELAERGWYKLERDPSLPEGASIITATYDKIGIKILEYVTEYETAEAAASRREIDRLEDVADMAMNLAAQEHVQIALGLLAQVLSAYGLSIPIRDGYEGAVSIIGRMELDQGQVALMGTLGLSYQMGIAHCKTDEVMTKTWEVMNAAKGDQDGGDETT